MAKQYVLLIEQSGDESAAVLAIGALSTVQKAADKNAQKEEYFWANDWRTFKDLYGREAYYRNATEWEGVTDEDLFEADFITYTIFEVKGL